MTHNDNRPVLTIDVLHEIVDSIPALYDNDDSGEEFAVALVDEADWKVQRIVGAYVNDKRGERMLILTYNSTV